MGPAFGTAARKGFKESSDDDVICRMRLGPLKVDFMPDDEAILGFSNRWYAKGIETAEVHQLTESLTIRLLTPALFIATKLEAFAGRGGDDLYSSRDAEDILLVVDGREELGWEFANADLDVKTYIAEQFGRYSSIATLTISLREICVGSPDAQLSCASVMLQ